MRWTYRRASGASCALAVVAAALVGAGATAGAGTAAAHRAAAPVTATPDAAAYQDWPMFLATTSRIASTTDANLSVAAASKLTLKWKYSTGRSIMTSASVVGTTAYVGSWNGWEYAVDTTTGALRWKKFLDTTLDKRCLDAPIGITSAATVMNNVLYVGGGGSYWYALNASTGAVLWKVFTGDPAKGYYNWASPLIVNGAAYIGIASNCDKPLVRGALLKVDLATHKIVATHYFVPAGEVGGGVWTSPTYDFKTNTVYVSTGTISKRTQVESEAIIALDAKTLQVKSEWQLPRSEATQDSDFGTTPTLMSDTHGRQLIAAANKNGVIYVLDRANLHAGPVWRQQVAVGGPCPQCGDGTIASGAYSNHVLYYAAGKTTVNGQAYGGSVRAFDAGTGKLLWTHPTGTTIVGSPALVNGMLAYVQGKNFEVLNAATGKLLFSYMLKNRAFGAVSVARSQFYTGCLDGRLYTFGLAP